MLDSQFLHFWDCYLFILDFNLLTQLVMNDWSINDKNRITISDRGEVEHQLLCKNYKTWGLTKHS